MIRTHTRWVSWLFICLICLCKAPVYAQTADVQTVQPSNENDAALYSLAAKLPSAKLNQMESLVTEISQVPHPTTREDSAIARPRYLGFDKLQRQTLPEPHRDCRH